MPCTDQVERHGVCFGHFRTAVWKGACHNHTHSKSHTYILNDTQSAANDFFSFYKVFTKPRDEEWGCVYAHNDKNCFTIAEIALERHLFLLSLSRPLARFSLLASFSLLILCLHFPLVCSGCDDRNNSYPMQREHAPYKCRHHRDAFHLLLMNYFPVMFVKFLFSKVLRKLKKEKIQ